MGFLRAEKDHFEVDGRRIILRGWALGSWMNFEHFMMGLPGTNSQIIGAFEDVYGREKATLWLDKMLECMVSSDDLA